MAKKTLQKTFMRGLLLVISVSGLVMTGAAQADTQISVTNGDTDLTSAATYGGTAPTAADDIIFQPLTYSPTTFTVNSAITAATLNDEDITQSLAIENSGGTASTLTLDGGTNGATGANSADLIYIASGTGNNLTIENGTAKLGLVLLGTSTSGVPTTASIDVGSGATLTLDSAVTFTSSSTINFTGAGTVVLAGTNTGGALLRESSGTIDINSAGALGSATLYFLGGLIDNTSGGSITTTDNTRQFVEGNVTYGASDSGNNLNISGGYFEMNSGGSRNVSVTVDSGTLSIGYITQGSSTDNLVKAGTGTLVVNAGNTATASIVGSSTGSAITVNAGALEIYGTTNYSAATQTTTVGSASETGESLLFFSSGNLSATGTVTVYGGGTFGSMSTNATANSITPNAPNLTLYAGATTTTQTNLALNLYSGGSDTITAGTLTLNGATAGNTVEISVSNPTGATLNTAANYYSLLTWTSGSAVSSNFSLAAGDTGTLDVVGDDLFYTAAAVPEPSTWALMAAGIIFLLGWERRKRQAAASMHVVL